MVLLSRLYPHNLFHGTQVAKKPRMFPASGNGKSLRVFGTPANSELTKLLTTTNSILGVFTVEK